MNEQQITKKYSFINYARFIAILLITNSHFDDVYPWPISFGGAPGVALFFMITGFLHRREPDSLESIERWYFKRLKRIYPSTWITTAILCGGGYYIIENYKKFLELFIYPTGFWFVAAIFELYLLFYLITKANVSYKTVLLFEIAWYLFRYIKGFENTFFVESSLRVTAGFIAMLIGGIWKQHINAERPVPKFSSKWINLLIAIVFLGAFLVLKILLSKNMLFELQLFTHVFSILFAYFFMVFMREIEDFLESMDKKPIGRILVTLSASSLEIYMIQRWEIDKLQGLQFPANLFLIIVTVMASGVLIHYITGFFVLIIPNKLKKIKTP